MRIRIQHIDLLSSCLVAAVAFVILALFTGPLALLLGVSSGMDVSAAFVSSLIVMAGAIALFALVGFVFAAITVSLYNFAACRLGGIEVEYRESSIATGSGDK